MPEEAELKYTQATEDYAYKAQLLELLKRAMNVLEKLEKKLEDFK